jgi:hypothetical protein
MIHIAILETLDGKNTGCEEKSPTNKTQYF